MTQKTIIIIPTYNERDNIQTLTKNILTQNPQNHILIIDDNSPDGTGKIADQLATQHKQIHTLHRKTKNGLGRAYCDGFTWALKHNYQYLIEMDGDLSHDPKDIPRLIQATQHADLTLGSRYLNGIRVINWPLHRLAISLCAAKYVQTITGMPFTDPTSGFKCFRNTTLQNINLNTIQSNGYSFQIELTHHAWRHGLKITEIPITFTDRYQGTSKMSPTIILEALLIVWKLCIQNKLRRKPQTQPNHTQ